ncbi:MAG: hypothetical protein Q7S51_11220 [Gallionellaceae bacterium]|nr:hypothetical protein [Gallionellaceae bacterium]
MKLAPRKIKWLARLMLGLVLFTQGIVGASACLTAGASPAQAYAAHPNTTAMPCHAVAQPNTNACLQQCTQADQVSLDHSISTVAPVAVAILTLPLSTTPINHLQVYPSHVALNTGPPLSIRFCSFLI